MAADDPLEVENWVRQRVLGSGGFGVVTLWKHKYKDEMIALKKCRSGTDNLLTAKHKERWSKEVEIMQRLSHPNVVRAITVPPDLATLRSELPLLCMEFCSKGDLRQVLNRGENCCGLPEADVRALIFDVKSAVQYLHLMKITHRDLKPENIVLQQKNGRVVYKLIDLGYAKELDQNSLCTSFVGTLQYLAPELFTSKTYTSSVDYWSLGLVSHEVITGVRPFLPNMAPVAWMSHVKNKSSDDISAYQAPDGTIVFCNELFPQNHITSCLKYHLERWLKALLEWNPKIRGRDQDAKEIVFDMVEEILNKKIVYLFSAATYQQLSYEIDESTALSTLQEWVRRDSGLAVEEQEWLLPNGSAVDHGKGAWQCWSEKGVKDGSPMAYVFRVGSLVIPQVTPRIPPAVSKLMEEPRMLLDYMHQKRAWSHAVFFLQQESTLYSSFQHASRVKICHMLSRHGELVKQVRSMTLQIHQVEAEQQFCERSLLFDQEQASHTQAVLERVLNAWAQICEDVATRLTKLRDAVGQLQVRSESVANKMATLQSDPYLHTREPSILDNLAEDGLKCLDELRRRPRESRTQRSDSVEMVKVVYKCLKQRDILLRDKDFSFHLQQVIELQAETEQLLAPVGAALQLLGRVRAEVQRAQIERQRDIWNLVAVQRPNGLTASRSLTLMATAVQNSSDVQLTGTQETQRSPSLPFVPTVEASQSTAGPMDTNNTSAMIRDNVELRYITQELMHESFQKYHSIINEGLSMNWSHLE